MSPVGEPIAVAIREHQISAKGLWKHQQLTDELHAWVNRFEKDFHLNPPTPVIAIEPVRINILGIYRLGRSGIGCRTTITLNECWLDYRPFGETLVTLIHELLHAFEEWHLGRENGGWYHSKAWRVKMAEVGIISDDHGHTISILPSFIQYLRRYGVEDFSPRNPNNDSGSQVRVPNKRRAMPKWICGCPSQNPVRAVKLHAICLDCEREYTKADP